MDSTQAMQESWETGNGTTRRQLLALLAAGTVGTALGLASGSALAQTPVANPFGEASSTGGTAVLSAIGRANPRIFIPTAYYGTDAFYVAKLVFTPLIQLDVNWQNLGPAIAESWETSADGTEVTFVLRKDVQFHDGTPLTAKDVEFTYKMAVRTDQFSALTDVDIIKGGAAYKAGDSEELPGVTVVDDYTVKFTLSAPSSVFTLKVSNIGILPAHKFGDDALALGAVMEELAFFAWTTDPPIGTGPWKIKEIDPEAALTLEANETYFRGRPVLDSLVLRIGMDGPSSVAGLQAGELDSSTVSAENAKTLESDTTVTISASQAMASEQVLITATEKDYLPVAVRQALVTALDIQTLIDTVVYGYGAPAASIMMYPALFPNDGLGTYGFDLDKAKSLLAEGGWDGSRTLKLGQFIADAAPSNQIAAIMSMWRDAGVNAEFTALDPASQVDISKAEDHVYDVVFTSFAWLAYDPSSAFSSFGTTRRPNYSNYTNPEFDQLMTEALRQPTIEEAVPLYQQAQVILQRDLPYAPLWIIPDTVAVRTTMHGGVLGRGPINDIQSELWWKEA